MYGDFGYAVHDGFEVRPEGRLRHAKYGDLGASWEMALVRR